MLAFLIILVAKCCLVQPSLSFYVLKKHPFCKLHKQNCWVLTVIFLSRCLSKLTFLSINFCALSLTNVRLLSSSMMLFCTSAVFDNGAWKV